MSTLIISDVHGNQAALRAVLDHAYDNYCINEVFCLGDVVGYGPLPYQAWKTLRGLSIPKGGWLAGNHERGLLGHLQRWALIQPDPNNSSERFEFGKFRRLAWDVLEHQKPHLRAIEEVWVHLESLPVMSNPRSGIFIAHGGFHSDLKRAVGRYTKLPVNEPREIAQLVSPDPVSSPRLFLVGHTHNPAMWRWESGRWEREHMGTISPLGNLEQSPLFLNPGSVGFPRDGSGRPTYMVINWDARQLHVEQICYNTYETRRLMNKEPYSALLSAPGFLPSFPCQMKEA